MASDLPPQGEMVQHRRLRMLRQRQELVAYIDRLAPDFPFERRTDPNVRGEDAYTPVAFGVSQLFPYVGVFTTAALASSVVLPMPGVIMTLNEYKGITSPLVPTAIETRLHRLLPVPNPWGIGPENKIVVVGEPDCAGANVMQIEGKGNVCLAEQRDRSLVVKNVEGKWVVPHDWVFVEWLEGTPDIPVGTELAVEHYGDRFFEDTPASCDTCFGTHAPLVQCTALGCTLKYHAACRPPAGPYLCYYHDRFAHLVPPPDSRHRDTRQRTEQAAATQDDEEEEEE